MFCDDAVVVVPKLAEAKHPVACPLQWLPVLLAFGSLPMNEVSRSFGAVATAGKG